MRPLIALGFLFFVSFSKAQTVPTLPVSENFNGSPTVPSWWRGQYVYPLVIKTPGPSGQAGDRFLHGSDISGASAAIGTNPAFLGNWKALLDEGRCLELCFDVRLFDDGAADTVPVQPHIHLVSGNVRATFPRELHHHG